MRLAFSSLRSRLLLLVLLAVVPALALSTYSAFASREVEIAEVKGNALTFTRLIAGENDQFIDSTRQLLIALTHVPEVRQGNPATCDAFFVELLKQFPSYSTLGLADPQGNRVCSALPTSEIINIADRSWFQRTIQTRDFAAGDYQIGRVSGKPVINFGYPILNENNQLVGVIFAGIDLASFDQMANHVQLPAGAVFIAIDRRGTILARQPDPEKWLGRAIPEQLLTQTVLAQGQGTLDLVDSDGVPRLYSFTPLSAATGQHDIYVIVGVSKQEAFANADQITVRSFAGLGIALALLFLVTRFFSARFILAPVDALVRATKRIAAGDEAARTGLAGGDGELGQLARAFDQMAESLEQREIARKESESALSASEEFRLKFGLGIERSGEAVFMTDLDGKIVYVNPAFEKIYGYTTAEAIGKTPRIIKSGVPSQESYTQFWNALLAKQVVAGEIVNKTKDGRLITVENSASPIINETGELIGFLAIQRDITDRKRAEKELRDSEEQYRLLFESNPHPMWAYDLETLAFLAVNDAAIRHYGYSRDEFLAMTIKDIRPAEDVPVLLDDVAKTYKNLNEAGIWRHRKKDGSIIFVEITSHTTTFAGRSARMVLANDVTERKRAEEQIQLQLRRLSALRDIDQAITSSLDLSVTLNILLSQVTTQLNADAADILLLNKHTRMLDYAAARGFRSAAITRAHYNLGEGPAGRAALERRVVQAANLPSSRDAHFTSRFLASEGFVTHYAVPLIAKGEVRGVLEVFHRASIAADPDWSGFMETLAGQAAIAVEDSEMFDRLQRSNLELMLAYDTTLEGWSRALDLRDRETEGHTQRVTESTVLLARTMGIGEEMLVHIRRGALLHDIGKMGIPDSILLKPGALTDKEWETMRKHPEYAYELLSPINYLHAALDIPRYHHEKWDGTGYPYGLQRDQIPLAARIFAVVDVWDALTSDRPYRSAWSKEQTIAHIRASAGTHFDPQVVEAFLRMLKEE